MIRLNMVVEGQTEQTFVASVLRAHLAQLGVFVSCRRVPTSRDKRLGRTFRGGLTNYSQAKGDLVRWMKQDDHAEVFFTTMFDLYSLPDSFPREDSGAEPREAAGSCTSARARCESLERALKKDISHPRFVPYLQLHEFEALLFADVAKLAVEFPDEPEAIAGLQQVANPPEEIDDGVTTAPSKRVIAAIPSYEKRKASAGPRVAEAIGLALLRAKCPHFAAWLDRLERLGSGD